MFISPYLPFPIYSINHPPQSYSWQSSPPIVTTKISNRDSRIFPSQLSTAGFVSRPYQAVSPRYGSSPRRFYATYSLAPPIHIRVSYQREFSSKFCLRRFFARISGGLIGRRELVTTWTILSSIWRDANDSDGRRYGLFFPFFFFFFLPQFFVSIFITENFIRFVTLFVIIFPWIKK